MATLVRGKNPNKPWTVRYYHEGRQREKSFQMRKDALDWKAKFEHDSREHTFVDPAIAGEKFGAVALRWLARHPGSPRTIENYETALRLHILPAFGSTPLVRVAQDREGVERFLRETLPAKGLKPGTIGHSYMVLRAVINDAVKVGRLHAEQNRIGGIELPPVSRKANITFATRAQIQAMADAMPGDYGFSIYLMRGCGLRLGEALGVQRGDFRDCTLRLTRQLRPDGKGTAALKHRNAGDYRDIPVPSYVRDNSWLGRDDFPPVSHRNYRRWFDRARDVAGLPASFTPHTLRHTFASVALAGGVPITDVSKWLGHHDINTTFGIYGHLAPASWERARGVLDAEWESD